MRNAAVALAVALAVVCGFAASTARAADSAKVNVGFSIDKFVKQGNALVANGRTVATYVAADGTTQTATQPFKAKVVSHGIRGLSASTQTCSILTSSSTSSH